MTTDFTVIIPARYASSRLPGKPLIDIAGQTMIERVYRQAVQSEACRVVIATDDERIVRACKQFNAPVMMTRTDHLSGTDRLHEVCQQLNLSGCDIVVNVQGDEPCIPPKVINQVAYDLSVSDWAACATLSTPIIHEDELSNPNAVKVVTSLKGQALYFSRSPIPYYRDPSLKNDTLAHRHIGIYAYRVSTLNQFVILPKSPLERAESLEQLRLLDNGLSISVAVAVETVPAGIDTLADLTLLLTTLESNS